MIAYPSYAPVFFPVSVMGSQFIAPYQLNIIVDTNSSGNFVITDIDHKIIFKVKPCNTTFHQQRVLLDAYDRPLVMLRKKIMSEHSRWNAFRGGSIANSDMMFSTKTRRKIQSKTNLNVFLSNKINRKGVSDFRITGSWSKRNCTICTGDSSTIIAQMHAFHSSENVTLVEGKFMVTIFPNVDYAFVVALLAIVDAMKSSYTNEEDDGEVVGAIAEIIAAIASY